MADLIGYALEGCRAANREKLLDRRGQEYVQVRPWLRLTRVQEADGMAAVRVSLVGDAGRVFRGPHIRQEDFTAVMVAMSALLRDA